MVRRVSLRAGALLAAMASLGLAATSPGAPPGADDARALYREGVRAFRAGNPQGALDLFRSSERADPTYPFPVFAKARIYQELFQQYQRHYEDATDAYHRLDLILRSSPPAERERDLYQMYYHQGLLHVHGGEPENGLEALDRFLEVYPGFYNVEEVHNARGVALYKLHRYDEAAEAFREAIRAKPEFIEAKVNLRTVYPRLAVFEAARANLRAGHLEDALERAERLRQIAPGYLPGARLQGEILQALHRPDDALCVYEEILAEAPRHPVTHGVRLDMARIFEDRGQPAEALRVLNENVRYFRDVPRDPTRLEVLRILNQLRGSP